VLFQRIVLCVCVHNASTIRCRDYAAELNTPLTEKHAHTYALLDARVQGSSRVRLLWRMYE
jgi:hypothetical protein